MRLLYEVLKLSPWHIQSGGAERNELLYRFVSLHITTGRGQYNLIELGLHVHVCVHMCGCGVKVDIHPDSSLHYGLNSLQNWQYPSDRTGATTFMCVCIGLYIYAFLGA